MPQTRVDAIYFVKHLKVKITHTVCYDIVLHYMLFMYVYIYYTKMFMQWNQMKRLSYDIEDCDMSEENKIEAAKRNVLLVS